jgi:hypothetical protein
MSESIVLARITPPAAREAIRLLRAARGGPGRPGDVRSIGRLLRRQHTGAPNENPPSATYEWSTP